MVTTVGTESEVLELLKDLIALDYDAAEAYQAAIDRLDDLTAKQELEHFLQDHLRHTQVLSQVVRDRGETPPTEGDFKRTLTRGKVQIGAISGDGGILLAMKSNEDDTNTAYERASNRDDIDTELRNVLTQALADERRHRAWIENWIGSM